MKLRLSMPPLLFSLHYVILTTRTTSAQESTSCSSSNPCGEGTFCDFGMEGGTSGHCKTCDWSLCFEDGISELGAKSCMEACATQCGLADGVGTLQLGSEEYYYYGMTGSPSTPGVSGPLVFCSDLICGEDVDASSGVCLIKRGNFSFVEKATSCKERGGIAALIYDDLFLDGNGVLDVNPGIPAIGIPEQLGLSFLEKLGSIITVALDEGEEYCTSYCSDLHPCPGDKSFCNYDWDGDVISDSYGNCEECWFDEGSAVEDDCFFSGLPLRGAQECASTCGSHLQFPTCKFCPSDLSLSNLGSGLEEGNEVCEFCPGGLQTEYMDQEVSIFGEGVTCFLIDEFYQKYHVSKSAPNCQLAQTVNYLCGCDGIGYGGANNESKQAALVWLPRVMAILSFLCSSFIIFDVARDKKRRMKLFGQLMIGLSVFDLFGSAAYALTSLPLPAEDFVYGSQGNTASCKAQGFFIQLGTTASYMNVSLAVYYLLMIKYSWPESRIKKWKVPLFACPILVGTTFAFAGIHFYDNMVLFCNNSSNYWSEIPLCIAIFVVTCIMGSVCLHVYKVQKAADRWRQGGGGNNLSEAVLWQSFWFTFAFYFTWVPYLALQFMWATGKAYSMYGFILYAGTACTMQGIWNGFVYIRPRGSRFNTIFLFRSRFETLRNGFSRTTFRSRNASWGPDSQTVDKTTREQMESTTKNLSTTNPEIVTETACTSDKVIP